MCPQPANPLCSTTEDPTRSGPLPPALTLVSLVPAPAPAIALAQGLVPAPATAPARGWVPARGQLARAPHVELEELQIHPETTLEHRTLPHICSRPANHSPTPLWMWDCSSVGSWPLDECCLFSRGLGLLECRGLPERFPMFKVKG